MAFFHFQCQCDGDIEYEFPCYNQTETIAGLWSHEDRRYDDGVYGGVLLRKQPLASDQEVSSSSNQENEDSLSPRGRGAGLELPILRILFPRIQSYMRKHANRRQSAVDGADLEEETDLYQWRHGSKYCLGDLEGMMTLDEVTDSIEVKVRGKKEDQRRCFLFLEEILGIIDQVFLTRTAIRIPERFVSPI